MSQTHYLGLDKNDVLFVNGSNGFDEMYLFDGEDLKRLIVAEKPNHKKVNHESAVKIDENGVHVAGKKLFLEGNLILRKEKAQKITKSTLDTDDINIVNLNTESINGTAELALATANKALEEIQLALSQSKFSTIEQTVNGIQTQINRLEEKIT